MNSNIFNILQKQTVKFIKPLYGTGIACKEKNRRESFQMCLSLSLHNYKVVLKVRISFILKLNMFMVAIWIPGNHESSLKKNNLQVVPYKMSLCLFYTICQLNPIFLIFYKNKLLSLYKHYNAINLLFNSFTFIIL